MTNPTDTGADWRDTLRTIEDGIARYMQATAFLPGAANQNDLMTHVFRGEADHPLPKNRGTNDMAPGRAIKSTLRRDLDKWMRQRGLDASDDGATVIRLRDLEEWHLQKARHHRMARPPLPVGGIFSDGLRGSDSDAAQRTQDLWDLRHYGAPVNRIDFSRSLPVALWFASQDIVDDDGTLQNGALVAYALTVDRVHEFDIPRSRSQRAVFVEARAGIIHCNDKALAAWPVPAEHKAPLRAYLIRQHGLAAETLFPDMQGAASVIKEEMKRLTDPVPDMPRPVAPPVEYTVNGTALQARRGAVGHLILARRVLDQRKLIHAIRIVPNPQAGRDDATDSGLPGRWWFRLHWGDDGWPGGCIALNDHLAAAVACAESFLCRGYGKDSGESTENEGLEHRSLTAIRDILQAQIDRWLDGKRQDAERDTPVA